MVDDDEVVDPQSLSIALSSLPNARLVVQEKVDGANVSVHFQEEWQPLVQKRSGLIGSGEHPQYDVFRNWCYENTEVLWALLGDRYCLFGEW